MTLTGPRLPVALAFVLLVGASVNLAEAQVTASNARLSVGLTVDRLVAFDAATTDNWGFGPIFRVGPDDGGWGPTFGLGWFTAELPGTPVGSRDVFAKLRVRPVMAGLGYGFKRGPWTYDVGVGVGWTFNRVDLLPAGRQYVESLGGDPGRVEVSNSLAVRPRLRIWYDTASRLAWTGSIGVVLVDPEVTLGSGPGRLTLDRNLNSLTIELGVAFALF